MKILIKNSISVLSIIVIVGCSPVYTIKPDYDEKSKTLNIDSLSIKPVIYHDKTVSHVKASDALLFTTQIFKTEDKNCPQIFSRYFYADTNYYYIRSAAKDVLSIHNGACQVKKVANLTFLQCKQHYSQKNKSGKIIKKSTNKFYVTESTDYQGVGFSPKIIVDLGTNSCYNKVKKYFEDITDKNEASKKND
jgi:hypothetical protein